MPARERWEAAALIAATVLLLAFLASLVLGLLRPASTVQTLAGSDPSHLPAVTTPPVPMGRVEVLNGSGRAGLARQATGQLRAAGFDVVYFGNATVPSDSSEVIDRVGSPGIARAAADRIGITRVRSLPDTSLYLDATVVLGKDWPKRAPAAVAPARRGIWVRLRSWLGVD